MSQTLILLRKNLLMFFRAKTGVVITFLVPIVLIYLFGHVFGLYRKDVGPNGIPLAVVNLSAEPAARQLVDALKAEKGFRILTDVGGADGTRQPLTEADVRAGLLENEYRHALILPADLMSNSGFGIRLQFLSNPRNEIESQTVNGLLQKTIFSNVPQLLGQSLQNNARELLGRDGFSQLNRSIAEALGTAFGGDPVEIQKQLEAGNLLSGVVRAPAAASSDSPAGGTASASAAGSDLFSRIVRIETEQIAGKEVKNPMAARTVGGYAIMFLLFAVSGSATSLFEEKNSGVFQRLLASPVRPAHILWARFLFGVILGLVQISALFLAGRLFFGLEIFAHAGALLAVAVTAAAACSAFGMLIAAVSPNAATAQGLATFIVISMSAVGGAWFPVSFMPDYIQSVAKFTLVYWSVEGFTDVLWAGLPLAAVLPKIGILAGIAAFVMGIAIWRFNRSQLFE